jgi:ribosome biogenesis GTPase
MGSPAAPPSALESLGWGPFFASQLGPSDAGLLPGRAVEDRGPRLLVRFEDAARLVTIPGRLRSAGEAPVVGDFLLSPAARGGPSEEVPVVRVLARRSRLSRNAAGRGVAEQLLAANVDRVIIVHGLDVGVGPRRLERTAAAIWAGGAEPAVVLAKLDLAVDPTAALAQAAAAVPGVPVLACSAATGEGLEAVRALVGPGWTAALTGPSGAGKSRLLNALVGAEVQPTAPVRQADGRGRHTTTGRRLLLLPGGGALVDGPGIRELQLWHGGGIGRAFEDVEALASGCRFGDCAHDGEPGCAVRAAAEAGALEPERLESWHKLRREARLHATRADQGAARAERSRWRAVSKEVRRLYRDRGRE